MNTTTKLGMMILTGLGLLPASRRPAQNRRQRTTLELEHELAMAAKRKPRDMRREWLVLWGE